MLFANIDQICKRILLERGLPIHFYAEMLLHSTACVRELSFDTLQLVNTLLLPTNEYNAIDLPDDFVDEIGLAYSNQGTAFRQLHHAVNINPLRYHDSTGAYAKPPQSNNDVNGNNFFGLRGLSWYWNINEYGEPTGRFFGARGASDKDGYAVIRERRQIQLTNDAPLGEVVLTYISNGQHADNASQVDSMAQACIQSYCDWMSNPQQRGIRDSPLGLSYFASKRELRSRKNILTMADIVHIVRRGYTASIKN